VRALPATSVVGGPPAAHLGAIAALVLNARSIKSGPRTRFERVKDASARLRAPYGSARHCPEVFRPRQWPDL